MTVLPALNDCQISDVQNTLENIPFFKGSVHHLKISRLDGWSNSNFLIRDYGHKYILRLPPPIESEEHIDRKAEEVNSTMAASLGLTPLHTYFDSDTGIQVRPYEEGMVMDEKHIQPSHLEKMALILRKLHTSHEKFKGLVDNFSIIDAYAHSIQKRGINLGKSYGILLKEIHGIKKVLSQLPMKVTPCHNDSNPRNFILTPHGMLLLDWEYAGNGDPTWDLAYLSRHENLNDKEEDIMLKAYYGKSPSLEYTRIFIQKPATEFILSLWIRLQITKGFFPAPQEELEAWELLGLHATEELMNNDRYRYSLKELELKN